MLLPFTGAHSQAREADCEAAAAENSELHGLCGEFGANAKESAVAQTLLNKLSVRQAPRCCAQIERHGAGRLVTRSYIKGVGAKKQRREPSGRLQRQNAPSGLGCVSENGTNSAPNKR
jgi:hypothetical protein